jgi:hypothetical protein
MILGQYWWPRAAGDIDRYVSNCQMCLSSKKPRDKTPGLLHPIPPPLQSWKSLVIDFKKMPTDQKGYNNLLVIIDRLSKAPWCILCKDTATAKDAARMYYKGPFRAYFLPEEIISDCGPQFVANFMDELTKILGIK